MQDTTDYGPAPFVGSIEDAAGENTNYRTTLWTGSNLQVTLMSIEQDHDIGLEVHNDNDQFFRIEGGVADVVMGPNQNELSSWQAYDGDAVIVPAGTWHNLTCASKEMLKVYSIYAPSHHPRGTVHVTKEDAEAAESVGNSQPTDIQQSPQSPQPEPTQEPEPFQPFGDQQSAEVHRHQKCHS